MIIYPAIDLIDGQCVRLKKGDYNQVTKYNTSPFEVLKSYEDQGAKWVHIVDLDGAKDENNRQLSLVSDIRKQTSLKIQTGGGIRKLEHVQDLLDQEVDRVVIGSMAVKDMDQTKSIFSEFGSDKICLALDVMPRDNDYYVATSGWQKESNQTLDDLLKIYDDSHILHVLCTDISKDGMMQGCNFDLYQNLVEKYPHINFQASGGIHQLSDIEKLKTDGVIIGKALYENVFTVEQAIKVAA
ncbi:MAG: 1-(5-phosphoribosyl)-5-[(5-phosphoribosylamino)methylideneamino]imidazole-4-carboxamide isomerase [Pseudomonadota bacterium]